MPYEDHAKASAQHAGPIGCAVLTASDTRTEDTDASGALIRQLLAEAGHNVVRYAVVRDEPMQIGSVLEELVGYPKCEVILISGGTGISMRDRTYEAVSAQLDKTIDGFGELFRQLSFAEIGPGAMLSRAIGGIVRGKLVFSMPGSTDAVRLAMRRLILPELAHLVWELKKE